MSDWQIGDLALCVKHGTRRTGKPCNRIAKGTIKRVGAVVNWFGQTGLVFDDQRSDHPTGSFAAYCFRKISPDKHEACEEEFVTLLNRTKRTVKA